jgi:hypothetical protein
MRDKGRTVDGNERKAAQVLDECLRGIESGQATVEDCLRLHPELRDSLGPLLALAVQTQQGLAPAAPSGGVRDQIEARLLNRLHKETASGLRTRPPSIRRAWSRRPAFALASLALILSLLVLTTGVAHASAEALPGDLLYPVKHGLEQVRLALTWTPQGQAALLVELADERLSEAEALVAVGRLPDIPAALSGYEDEITALIGLAAQVPQDQGAGSLQDLGNRLSHHLDVLETVRGRVPATAQGAVEEALERAGQGQAVVEQVRAGGNPSELAPGQQGRPTEQPHGNPQGDRGHGGGGQAGGPNNDRGGASARATPSPTVAE